MAEKTLEIRLGKAKYDPHSLYTWKQQFQEYVADILSHLSANQIIDLHEDLRDGGHVLLRNKGDEKDSIRDSLRIYAAPSDDDHDEGYFVMVRRDKDGHVHLVGERTEESSGDTSVKKYFLSALYQRKASLLTADIRDRVLRGGLLDNASYVSWALDEIKNFALMEPEVFRGSFRKSLAALDDTAGGLLPIASMVESMILDIKGVTPCEQEWKKEYYRCTEYLKTLR